MSSHCHNYLGPERKREETSLNDKRGCDTSYLSQQTENSGCCHFEWVYNLKKNASSLGIASTATGHDENFHMMDQYWFTLSWKTKWVLELCCTTYILAIASLSLKMAPDVLRYPTRLIWSCLEISRDIQRWCTTIQNLSSPGIAWLMIHQRPGLLATEPTPETWVTWREHR